jgi:parallel beta-helix repeat protein
MRMKLGKATVMIAILLMAMALMVNSPTVKASGTIYIRADGSIDPSTAPISSVDNITYTLTGNITSDADGIVIERDNIVVDGAGYTVQGAGNGTGIIGIDLSLRINVTIKNMEIKAFDRNIDLDHSFYCNISGNNVGAGYGGIVLVCSEHNSIFGNNVTSLSGIALDGSSNNTISGNNVTDNGASIFLGQLWGGASSNYVYQNNFVNNGAIDVYIPDYPYVVSNATMVLMTSSNNNHFYHNNFVDNTGQIYIDSSSIDNVWDDGYPSGGNYWSDYTGVDVKKGPSQTEPGSDGIGDWPYYVNDWLDMDWYPLMRPYGGSYDIGIIKITTSKTVVGQGYNMDVSATVENQGVSKETFNVTVYANTTIIETRKLTLASGNSTTLTFTWNTAGFAKGNYTISAYAWPVLGETDTNDNNMTSTIQVHVGVPGNVWGNPKPTTSI